ncbi:MAG: hypothetical protein E6K78_09360, partial [Candidatus Eisenbacteria bacterium]
LDVAAIRSVRQWRWKPGEQSGRPTASWVVIPFRFSFGDSALPYFMQRVPSIVGQRRLRGLFQVHLESLRRLESRLPSASDAPLRQRIIREADHLDSVPQILPHVRNGLYLADSLLRRASEVPSAPERRRLAQQAVAEAAKVVGSAPWQYEAYGTLGRAFELLQRRHEAALNLEIYSAGEWRT